MINVARDHRKQQKKRKTIAPSQITKFFGSHKRYNKLDLAQLALLEDLALYM
jgi:hypothetical protein